MFLRPSRWSHCAANDGLARTRDVHGTTALRGRSATRKNEIMHFVGVNGTALNAVRRRNPFACAWPRAAACTGLAHNKRTRYRCRTEVKFQNASPSVIHSVHAPIYNIMYVYKYV